MIEEALESMVTHLVQCTCNGTINCPKTCNNEVVEHEDLALKQPISAICTSDAQNKTFMAWNSILKGLLTQCTQLTGFGRETVSNPSPLVLNWQQIHNRKVLAPLALKQNTDNIIAGNLDMKRKRKSDVDNTSWTPPNKIPKLDLSKDNLKLCSIVLKRTSVRNLIMQYKCISKTPFVKLFDVFKEIPQEKEIEEPVVQKDFMNFFGLQSRDPVSVKSVPEFKVSSTIKLTKTVSIPFSSIYGQTLLSRERHCLPQEAALKKIERTDWYLKPSSTNSNADYSPLIAYEKKPKYIRDYKFPKRQFHQKCRSLKREFLEYICKPVCVKLEIMDMSVILAKKEEKAKGVEEPVVNIEEDTPAVNRDVIIISDDEITLSDSDSDIISVQNIDLQMVAVNDNSSACSDVSNWSDRCLTITGLDSITRKNFMKRSCRLACNSLL